MFKLPMSQVRSNQAIWDLSKNAASKKMDLTQKCHQNSRDTHYVSFEGETLSFHLQTMVVLGEGKEELVEEGELK